MWDWRKLPGVTCAQTEPPAFKTSFVDRDFVGGVSDGSDGCCALDYERDGVRAKKAWFFAGDMVVCLGADISGRASETIATTLNQTLRRGAVRAVSAGAAQTIAPGRHTLTGIDSVEHDGWRYTLLEKGVLHLETGPVTGNWRRVFNNPETPAPDVTKEVFLLWLDHGRDPQGASYGYAVTPASSEVRLRVLENSATRQAVLWPNAKIGIVFWAAGEITLPDGRRIASDEPCLLLDSRGRSNTEAHPASSQGRWQRARGAVANWRPRRNRWRLSPKWMKRTIGNGPRLPRCPVAKSDWPHC